MPEVRDPRPITKHLPSLSEPRNRGPAATVGEHVKAMTETEGWKELVASIDSLLHWEQRRLMTTPPGDLTTETHERAVGQWAGLRMAISVAEGLVAHGEQASKQMRDAEAAA